MKIHDCKQGSPEWLALRAGRPTASEFDALISPKWEARTGKGPRSYLVEKLTERVMGMCIGDIRAKTFSSEAMTQGSMLEHEAIPYFELMTDKRVQRVGFVTTDDGRIGCSPDGLIGDDCGIEAKCPQPDTHLGYLLSGTVPEIYLAQVHGCMYVTGRSSWYFISYSRQFPALIVLVKRDPAIIAAIDSALTKFLRVFDLELENVRAMRAEQGAQERAA